MSATATVTVLFCDLVGSTERLARLGDDAGDEFRRRFFASLRAAIEHHRGTEVKNLGDGVMVVFPTSAVDAIACALEMHENAASLDPLDPALLRVGLSAGEVSHEGDDWFGTPVVEAARLCAAADSGGTLATDVVRALVGSRGTYELASVGELDLKGLPRPVATVSVRRRDGAASSPAVSSDATAPAATASTTPPTRAGAPAARSRGLVLALVALALVAGAAGIVLLGGEDDEPSAATTSPPTTGVETSPTRDETVGGGGEDSDLGALSSEPVLREVAAGTESTLTFQVGDDERLGLRWLFDGEQEQDVRILLRAGDGMAIADESVVGSTFAGPYDLPAAGAYTLQITSSADSSDAELRLIAVPPDQIVRTELGVPIDVVTTVSGQEAHVEVDAEAGQEVWLRWTAPGDDQRYKFLHLMAPDGVTELLELDALDLGESEWVTLTETGTYTVVVQWPDAGTGFGTVEVRAG